VLSGDRQSIDITLNPSDLDNFVQYIPGGSIINILLTEVTSPTSFRPLDDSISYKLLNSDGYLIESVTSGMLV
jgi:hypothetical protein